MKGFLTGLLFVVALQPAGAQPIPRWKAEDLMNYIQTNDSILVVNFWATFCGPCVAELPYFHTVTASFREQQVKLVLVSLDFEEYYPEKIRSFADKRGYTAYIVWLDEEKPDEFCPKIDSAWTGSMPATLFINRKTGYRKFIESTLEEKELEAEIKKMLQEK
ncbi:MAG TPA: TlpA disulfide reductase family protein [Lacibacter sp.]|nr:TlpA disulfide reductase family protein [Lacibacter sp.]HMO89746.1 TlpA disulfide reductase family protein [Lacibacter sp.]HMP87244.1 TlpA disulfide reductase family protein [Lacibacter sp.]